MKPGGVLITWGSILTAVYAGLIAFSSYMPQLQTEIHSVLIATIVGAILATAIAFIARLAGIEVAQQANADYIAELETQLDQLKTTPPTQATPPEPAPAPTITHVLMTYSDGTEHEVQVQ